MLVGFLLFESDFERGLNDSRKFCFRDGLTPSGESSSVDDEWRTRPGSSLKHKNHLRTILQRETDGSTYSEKSMGAVDE